MRAAFAILLLISLKLNLFSLFCLKQSRLPPSPFVFALQPSILYFSLCFVLHVLHRSLSSVTVILFSPLLLFQNSNALFLYCQCFSLSLCILFFLDTLCISLSLLKHLFCYYFFFLFVPHFQTSFWITRFRVKCYPHNWPLNELVKSLVGNSQLVVKNDLNETRRNCNVYILWSLIINQVGYTWLHRLQITNQKIKRTIFHINR